MSVDDLKGRELDALVAERLFGLQRLVHALMPAILHGVRRLDQLGPNAEPHPPDREGREPAERVGSKRLAVVGADPLGQAIAPEQTVYEVLPINRECTCAAA